ncbi:MAG TPA: hypothetical protein HA282_04275 [Nanoarchaeota archaeon]|nr:hypothetical protein [Candidatus Pacearchaeota archaeon]HIH17898.1 hypothetical protein [Nanoarchaeota archaeon]HIH33731.1 hypothetical protein [Nanoarchaeota archaeon]HIH51318.1 hypothetical protein [Nanoarchaeota archaeon]HIH66402.1 hypothetical protein [Nanoarchaeota archaeon]
MCGIAAVYLFDKKGGDKERDGSRGKEKNVVPYQQDMLLQLQHRGQKSVGFTTYNSDREMRIESYRGLGMVNAVFKEGDREENKKIIEKFRGTIGLGHVRYATSGERVGSDVEQYSIQPFESHGNFLTWDWFAFAFNGNISNYKELEGRFLSEGHYFPRRVDTELIRRWLRIEHTNSKSKPDLTDLFSKFSKEFEGAYSMVFLNGEEDLAVVRDPKGVMPLCYGFNEDFFAAASESVALERLGLERREIKDVGPGEIITVGKDRRINISQFSTSNELAHCIFQYVYFAKSVSVIDGVSVSISRRNLGRSLADIVSEAIPDARNNSEYLVVHAPRTAEPAAKALADALGLREESALEVVEAAPRSFINEKTDITKVLDGKFVVHDELTAEKKVILVDDSIIRGNTSKKLIKLLKERGQAKEVHLVSTFYQIRHPCYMGIDFATYDELIAAKNDGDVRKIARQIGADSVIYQTHQGVIDAVGKEGVCTACYTGEYPFPSAQKRALEARMEFEAER